MKRSLFKVVTVLILEFFIISSFSIPLTELTKISNAYALVPPLATDTDLTEKAGRGEVADIVGSLRARTDANEPMVNQIAKKLYGVAGVTEAQWKAALRGVPAGETIPQDQVDALIAPVRIALEAVDNPIQLRAAVEAIHKERGGNEVLTLKAIAEMGKEDFVKLAETTPIIPTLIVSFLSHDNFEDISTGEHMLERLMEANEINKAEVYKRVIQVLGKNFLFADQAYQELSKLAAELRAAKEEELGITQDDALKAILRLLTKITYFVEKLEALPETRITPLDMVMEVIQSPDLDAKRAALSEILSPGTVVVTITGDIYIVTEIDLSEPAKTTGRSRKDYTAFGISQVAKRSGFLGIGEMEKIWHIVGMFSVFTEDSNAVNGFPIDTVIRNLVDTGFIELGESIKPFEQFGEAGPELIIKSSPGDVYGDYELEIRLDGKAYAGSYVVPLSSAVLLPRENYRNNHEQFMLDLLVALMNSPTERVSSTNKSRAQTLLLAYHLARKLKSYRYLGGPIDTLLSTGEAIFKGSNVTVRGLMEKIAGEEVGGFEILSMVKDADVMRITQRFLIGTAGDVPIVGSTSAMNLLIQANVIANEGYFDWDTINNESPVEWKAYMGYDVEAYLDFGDHRISLMFKRKSQEERRSGSERYEVTHIYIDRVRFKINEAVSEELHGTLEQLGRIMRGEEVLPIPSWFQGLDPSFVDKHLSWRIWSLIVALRDNNIIEAICLLNIFKPSEVKALKEWWEARKTIPLAEDSPAVILHQFLDVAFKQFASDKSGTLGDFVNINGNQFDFAALQPYRKDASSAVWHTDSGAIEIIAKDGLPQGIHQSEFLDSAFTQITDALSEDLKVENKWVYDMTKKLLDSLSELSLLFLDSNTDLLFTNYPTFAQYLAQKGSDLDEVDYLRKINLSWDDFVEERVLRRKISRELAKIGAERLSEKWQSEGRPYIAKVAKRYTGIESIVSRANWAEDISIATARSAELSQYLERISFETADEVTIICSADTLRHIADLMNTVEVLHGQGKKVRLAVHTKDDEGRIAYEQYLKEVFRMNIGLKIDPKDIYLGDYIGSINGIEAIKGVVGEDRKGIQLIITDAVGNAADIESQLSASPIENTFVMVRQQKVGEPCFLSWMLKEGKIPSVAVFTNQDVEATKFDLEVFGVYRDQI